MWNIKGVDKSVWIRITVLFLTLVNQISISFFNFELLPFGEEEIYEGVSIVLTTVATIWASWMNNSFTWEGQLSDEELKERKRQRKENK